MEMELRAYGTALPGLPEDFQSLTPEQQQAVLEQLLQQAINWVFPVQPCPWCLRLKYPATIPGSGSNIPAPALEEQNLVIPEEISADSPTNSQPTEVAFPRRKIPFPKPLIQSPFYHY